MNTAAIAAAAFALASLAGGAMGAAGTDVAIATPDISFSTASPVDGSSVSILVLVHNLGDDNATNVIVSAAITATNELIGTTTVSVIQGQSQAETAILWNVSYEGNVSITVTVQATETDTQPANNVAVSQTLFVRSRPDLKVDSVTFDNPTPAPGTLAVGIYTTISNIGGSNASIVRVALFDGPPSDGVEIYNTTLLTVPLDSPQTVVFFWDIQDKGGRHDIYAVVQSSTPAEKPANLANNRASGRLLVLTLRDYIVTAGQTITVDPLFQGFVIVRGGGNLTISGSVFTLHQQRNNQYDFIVETGGRLNLAGASVVSDYDFGVTLNAGGTLTLSGVSTLGASVASTGGALWCSQSTIRGGLQGTFSVLSLTDCAVEDGATVSSPQASLTRSSIMSSETVSFVSSIVVAEWLKVESEGDPPFFLGGGSSATLMGIETGSISVETGSQASIWRQVNFEVSDLTGIPIAGASIESRFVLNNTLVETSVTDATGRATAWLLTDVLTAGAPQYLGSYQHLATYAVSYHTSGVSNLAFYPTLTSESNSQRVQLVFGVIDPADLFAPTVGDKLVAGTPWDVADFNQTGNVEVQGILNIDGAFTVWQTRDFEVAFVITTGTVNVGPGGSIRSNHQMNIYNYDGSLSVVAGALDVNAVVTFGTGSVALTNGTTMVRGSFVLQGASFTLGSSSTWTGTKLYARGAGAVILDGATATVESVDVVTAGSITVKGSTLRSAGGITLRSTAPDKILESHATTLQCGAGGQGAFEAQFINMTETSVEVCAVSLFSAGQVQARDTSFTQPLTGFRAGSTAALYDVSYPALIVDPSATVITYHKLTIAVLDSNQNIVTQGDYTITTVPGNQVVASSSLGAVVEWDLEASRIQLGFENFTGNYRVTVAPSEPGVTAITRDVVMDMGREETFAFAVEIVKPSSVEITATATPSTVLPNAEISITGTVRLNYPNRATPLVPPAGLEVKVVENGTVMATVTTDSQGAFNWTAAFAPSDTTPGVKQLRIEATSGGVQGSASVDVTLLRPAPNSLVLTLELALFEKNVGQEFFIAGQVKYARPDGSQEPADNVTIRATFVNPPQTDAPPTGHSDGSGVFSFRVPGRTSAKIYSMVVSAQDSAFGLTSNPVPVTVQVGQAPTQTAGGLGSGLTLYLLIGAIAAVGGVIGFMVINARRQSVNYVECGNCGRPAHEGDKKCPSCGVEFEADIAKCSHCASWIPADAVRCPKCNTEFKPIGDAGEAPKVAPDAAAPEGVKAEVTTVPAAVKAPVAVKKKVLKTAEPAPGAPGKDTQNPWEAAAQPAQPAPAPEPKPAEGPKPAEKKPEEKKEKGLFDDL